MITLSSVSELLFSSSPFIFHSMLTPTYSLLISTRHYNQKENHTEISHKACK